MKKIYTREEFEVFRMSEARYMASDDLLKSQANGLLQSADKYHWIHQTNWMGQPCLQLPQDLFAMQEIIWKTAPDHVIEVGVAWGGTSLFLNSILNMLPYPGDLLGIDKFIPDDLRYRLAGIDDEINLWQTDSLAVTEEEMEERFFICKCDNNMVILDSHHTHEHVYNELKLYSEYVKPGNYIIVCDTVVEDFPSNRERPWGPGNSPRTAIQQFLSENDDFEIDREIENKLLLSCQPDGYLRRTK